MIKSLILKTNIQIVLLVAFTARLVVFGASIGDALALFALAGLFGFNQWLNSNKEEPVNEKVKADITELKTQVSNLGSALQLKTLTKR